MERVSFGGIGGVCSQQGGRGAWTKVTEEEVRALELTDFDLKALRLKHFLSCMGREAKLQKQWGEG